MRQTLATIMFGLAAALFAAAFLLPQPGIAQEDKAQNPAAKGKELAVENCQACHYFDGTDQAGTVGPPLLAMKPRFPERQKLEKLIYDPQVVSRSHTMMPPFGRNRILSEDEIKLIVDFLYTL